MNKTFAFCVLVFSLSGCDTANDSAYTLYHNGNILTMDGDEPTYIESLLEQNGLIVAVGNKADIINEFGEDVNYIDLNGKFMLPGFIDPHSHFFNALTLEDQLNISSPPIGTVKIKTEDNCDLTLNMNEITSVSCKLSKFKNDKNVPPGELIIAYGYDANNFDGSDMTVDDFPDSVKDNPVILIHVSTHGAVLNENALRKFGFLESDYKIPDGGTVSLDDMGIPNGLVMETAYLPVMEQLPIPSPETLKNSIEYAQEMYLSEGVTTANEGATHINQLELLKIANEKEYFDIDLIALPIVMDKSYFDLYSNEKFGEYNKNLKIGGIKVPLDGSPQAKTAFFLEKYITGNPAGENDKEWYGNQLIVDDEINDIFKVAYDNNIQVFTHANGDAAIQLALNAHYNASKKDKSLLYKDRRTTIIHAQFANDLQLEKFAEYNMIPSFYTEHTYFFSEAHVKNRGEKQAFFMSPMKSAMDKGLKPTNHSDFSVLPINKMWVIHSAVNRLDRLNTLIDPIDNSQKVSVYDALKSITSHAARQYFEEDSKGKLKVGYIADFVVLDENPISIKPTEIANITVLNTIKDGKQLYPETKKPMI